MKLYFVVVVVAVLVFSLQNTSFVVVWGLQVKRLLFLVFLTVDCSLYC